MMEKILVIGYGNTLRRDDGLGIEVVRRLQDRITYPNCTFLSAFQLQPEMILQFKETDWLFIVDASTCIRPGAIKCTQLPHIDQTELDSYGTHFLTPQRTLLLCEQLYGYAPKTKLFTIGGEDFDYGEGFSALIKLRLDRLVEKIETEIHKIMEVAYYA